MSAAAERAVAADANLAAGLRANAARFPDRPALVFPDGDGGWGRRTYAEVEAASDAYAHGFARLGIERGVRVVLMVKPGPDLFEVLFALFKTGAVPVVVDPGMGLGRMLHCYAAVGAEAFVGIPAAHAVRLLRPRSFGALRAVVTVGRRWGWGGAALSDMRPAGPFPLAPVSPDDLLMVSFTTGSTGPAKPVEQSVGVAAAMVEAVGALAGARPGDTTLVTLPLLGVIDLLLGATSVLAPMDAARPAKADPAKIADAIARFGVRHLFASPALLRRVAEHGVALPSLRTVVSGGAPVDPAIVAGLRALLPPEARVETTYGATEALPIASIEAADILGETAAGTAAGRGTCVGRPVGGTRVRLMCPTGEPVPAWRDDLAVAPGEVGEIVIDGPVVSRRYHRQPAADALHKVADGASAWHRTGDLGTLDAQGRLWFCGRKSHRVETAEGPLDTARVEGVFDAHPDVLRTALVGVGGRPVVCVEARRRPDAGARARIEAELRAMAAANPMTRGVERFLFHPGFPVDVRHNAKIDREALAAWAARKLSGTPAVRPSPLHAVPILGWLFLLYGLVGPMPHPALWWVWGIDLFLSVVVHGAQLPFALAAARRAGHTRGEAVALTFLLGATWWKTLAREEKPR